jgi:hypothetical protein
MSEQDLINWGEISRLLSGSRMNIRKNRIPEKYKAEITNLVKHIKTWQAEIQTVALADEAGGQKNKNNLQDVRILKKPQHL